MIHTPPEGKIMARLLIVYGTTEGHTRKICEKILDWLIHRNYGVRIEDAANLTEYLDLRDFDGFIIAGSLHQTKHQGALSHFVKSNVGALQHKPSMFLSVSLTAALDDEDHQAEARQCIGKFIEETGWIPMMAQPVAGALKYSEYDFFKRLVLKMIAKQMGGDTDTSKDYEYTNWTELEAYVDEYLARVRALKPAPTPNLVETAAP